MRKGRIVTIEATGTQTDIAGKIIEKGYGRIEIRKCYIFCGGKKWTGLSGVGVIILKGKDRAKS